jgi:hypothetical protein
VSSIACCDPLAGVFGGASGVFDVMRLRSCLVSVQCREAVLHGWRAPDEMWGNWHFLLSNLVVHLWFCYLNI